MTKAEIAITRDTAHWVAYFADPEGMPRAFGQATTEIDAVAIAQIELIGAQSNCTACANTFRITSVVCGGTGWRKLLECPLCHGETGIMFNPCRACRGQVAI